MKLFSLCILLFIVSACSGNPDEKLLDKPTIMNMAKKVDPDIVEVLPESLDKGLKCSDYAPGCVGAFVVRTRLVEYNMVRFDSVENAKRKATELNQFYKQNWVFDEVRGEPVIEDFVKKAFDAKKGDDPNVKIIKKGAK
jgi:hypothetical protein